jgi:hypothetical protein
VPDFFLLAVTELVEVPDFFLLAVTELVEVPAKLNNKNNNNR